jgi:hypothetical protein
MVQLQDLNFLHNSGLSGCDTVSLSIPDVTEECSIFTFKDQRDINP